MSTSTLPAHGLLHMGVGVFRVLQIQALRNASAMHLEGQEVFRLLEQTFTKLSAMLDRTSGEELETRLRKLLLLQEQTASYLVQTGQPRPDQLPALLHAAADLEAWVPIKLRNCPLGAPERFPFVAALTYARSSCSDAVLLQGGDNQVEEQALQRLRDEISAEAYALCNGQTLYALAVPRFEALIGYALLRRGLGGAGSVQVQASGFPMMVYDEQDSSWDVGLGVLRSVLMAPSDGPPCKSLPLKTLADYEWFVSWAGLDRETFDVHSIKELSTEQLASWLGLPEDLASNFQYRNFRSAFDMNIKGRFSLICSKEFGWSVQLVEKFIEQEQGFDFLSVPSRNICPLITSLSERFYDPFRDRFLRHFNRDRVVFKTYDGDVEFLISSGQLRVLYKRSEGFCTYEVHVVTYSATLLLAMVRNEKNEDFPLTMQLIASPHEFKVVLKFQNPSVEFEVYI